MIKLQDFATECNITDRQVQRLIKKYEAEIEGHFERKGANGTWLDDEACKILRSKMKVKEIVVADQNVSELQAQIKELQERMERKDQIIEQLQARELLKDSRIDALEKIQLQLEEKKQEEIDAAVMEAKEKLQQDLAQRHGEEIDRLNEKHDAAVIAAKEKVQQELEQQHEEKIDQLNEKHDAAVSDLQRQLQEEKTRKLSWKERFLGRKG